MSFILNYKGKNIDIGSSEAVWGAAGMPTLQAASVSTDTRTIKPGALFFALKGDSFDGHAYVKIALEKGAAGCVVGEDFRPDSADLADARIVRVASPLDTLHELARKYREQLRIPIIGVTGSNGKTTTKNLIAGVLSQKYKTVSTAGNLNNHIGLPMSILNIEPDTEIAVFEAGINHVGEMSVLSGILKPTAAVITNIGNAHIEFFGSREAIAREKAMIASASLAGASARIPLFIPKGEEQIGAIEAAVPGADIVRVDLHDPSVSEAVKGLQAKHFKYISTPHVMADVSLAIAVGQHFGVPSDAIVEGVLSAELESGRFDIQEMGESGRLVIIDDTYNANPDSVCGSLSALRAMYQDRMLLLVLGELKEQGDFLKEGYAKIYGAAKELGLRELFLVGISADDFPTVPEDVSPRLHYFASKQLCIDVLTTYIEESLKKDAAKSMAILVKGSRSSKMEDVVAGLMNDDGVQKAERGMATQG